MRTCSRFGCWLFKSVNVFVAATVVLVALTLSVSLWACSSERAVPSAPSSESSASVHPGPASSAEDPPGNYDVTRVGGADAAAYDWCRYRAIWVTVYDPRFPIAAGDRFCFACPDGGTCPGTPSTSIWFTVYRDGVPVAAVQARRLTAECQDTCGPFPKFVPF